jgi:hypothetical protein
VTVQMEHQKHDELCVLDDLCRVPEGKFTVFHSCSNNATRSVVVHMSPRDAVEPGTPCTSKTSMHGSTITTQNYLEVSVTTPLGFESTSAPRWNSSLFIKSGCHISSWDSLEKDSSRAPATVPVAISGSEDVGDQAKVAVLWISFCFIVDVDVRGR